MSPSGECMKWPSPVPGQAELRRDDGRGSLVGGCIGMMARWRLKPFDSGQISALSRGARISPLVAQLLINRGIDDPQRAVAFLQAKLGSLNNPESMPGVCEAAERIVRAIREDR